MEEGSLLAEALKRENGLENTLIVDIYLPPFEIASPEHLIALSRIAIEINTYIHSEIYPWLIGGDGPVFGIHETGGIPHLRTSLCYGVSVADEWKLIGLCGQYSSQNPILAMEFWDQDDGQVLLIQSAHELPAWVDQIGPPNCRHRCWILRGKVNLIAPFSDTDAFLSIPQSLELLRSASSLVECSPTVNNAIQERVARVNSANHYHRGAVVVPRSVVHMLETRPDLVDAACLAFSEYASTHAPLNQPPLAGTCEDWVWMVHRFGRTHYSMLRTVTAAPYWKAEDTIPSVYQSVEVKRLKRQCNVQGTTHLRHALQLGLRLVAGLDYILMHRVNDSHTNDAKGWGVERRVQCWSRIEKACSECRVSATSPGWLLNAWQQGPNEAAHDLEPILKCPVFQEELKNQFTPLTQPEKPITTQIRSELLVKVPCNRHFEPPTPRDVDDERWMIMPDEDGLELYANARPTSRSQLTSDESNGGDSALSDMLSGVQSFMHGKSTIEGVSHQIGLTRPLSIDPTVFLNILHSTLQAECADDLDFTRIEKDLFFSKDDYQLDDEEGGDGVDKAMTDVMSAMDNELRIRPISENGSKDVQQDESVRHNAEILTNLLRSLEAGHGKPSPVRNILNEMGLDVLDGHFEEE